MSESAPVVPHSNDHLAALFNVAKPVIGMVHVAPLPGSPRYEGNPMGQIVERALEDATACEVGGMDGLVVENGGDLPFLHPESIGPETVAAMATVASAIRQQVSKPIGINVLANGVVQSLAVAKASGAQFVRANQWVNAYIANEGLVQGIAAVALRYRAALKAADIRVFADVHVKHGSHAIVADRTIAEQTHDVEFFDADVLIATGQRTSDPTPVGEIAAIKDAATLSVLIGSGLRVDNVSELLSVADGAIVGSGIKDGGVWWNPVSPDRVKELMYEVNAVRQARTWMDDRA